MLHRPYQEPRRPAPRDPHDTPGEVPLAGLTLIIACTIGAAIMIIIIYGAARGLLALCQAVLG